MWTLDWSKVTTWTPEMIQARQAEQQTVLLERMANTLDRMARIAVDMREQEAEKRQITELALALMVERQTVLLAFNAVGRMGLTDLRDRLLKKGLRCYGDSLVKAVPLTDYLVAEPAGAGWRIWRAEDYAVAKQTA